MAGQILIWILSAAGIALFAWCLFGWLLIPASEDTVTVVYASQTEKAEHDVRLWLWLRGIGVQSGRLIVVDRLSEANEVHAARSFCEEKNVEFCSEAELPLALGLE